MEINGAHAYYINLDRRQDRNEECITNLLSLGFDENKIVRFSAINGENILEDLKNKNLYSDYLIKYLHYIPLLFRRAELARILSHYFCLYFIYDNPNIQQNELVYIFEDDFKKNISKEEFIGINNILQEFNKINDCDILFIGGFPYEQNFIPSDLSTSILYTKKTDNLYLRNNALEVNEPTFNRGTYGYAINKGSIPRIISSLIQFFQQKTINNLLAIDHIYFSLFMRNKLICYDYFPQFINAIVGETTDIQNDFNTFSFYGITY